MGIAVGRDQFGQPFFADVPIKFHFGGLFRYALGTAKSPSLIKFPAVEKLELSAVHAEEVIQHHPQKGQYRNDEHPPQRAGGSPAMVNDGADSPKAQQDVNIEQCRFQVVRWMLVVTGVPLQNTKHF